MTQGNGSGLDMTITFTIYSSTHNVLLAIVSTIE